MQGNRPRLTGIASVTVTWLVVGAVVAGAVAAAAPVADHGDQGSYHDPNAMAEVLLGAFGWFVLGPIAVGAVLHWRRLGRSWSTMGVLWVVGAVVAVPLLGVMAVLVAFGGGVLALVLAFVLWGLAVPFLARLTIGAGPTGSAF